MAKPSIQLNSGYNMPAFGFGTWLAAKGVVAASVKKALESGYKHIDCAHLYLNEAEIGVVFKEVFSSGKIKREDVFITSKLWIKDFDQVKEACKLSLKNLQLDYLDLYLIHLPFECSPDMPGYVPSKGVGLIGWNGDRSWKVWKCMEELVDEGLVRSIGISNYTVLKTEDLMNRSPRIKPACNQVEMHPYLPQKKLMEYCQKQGITIVAYSPLGNPGRPVKAANEKEILEDEVASKIASKHNATIAQVLIAWGIHRGTGVLAKSTTVSRIEENFGSLKIKLDTEDMAALDSIQHRNRYLKQGWALRPDDDPKSIWDGEFLG